MHDGEFLLFGMRALNLFILRLLFNGVVTLIHARIKEAFENCVQIFVIEEIKYACM
jgi:hypothetical protein